MVAIVDMITLQFFETPLQPVVELEIDNFFYFASALLKLWKNSKEMYCLFNDELKMT